MSSLRETRRVRPGDLNFKSLQCPQDLRSPSNAMVLGMGMGPCIVKRKKLCGTVTRFMISRSQQKRVIDHPWIKQGNGSALNQKGLRVSKHLETLHCVSSPRMACSMQSVHAFSARSAPSMNKIGVQNGAFCVTAVQGFR